jgi:hypothetical protein
MLIEVPIAQSISIREAGFDEYWLQEQIMNNPSALGLGSLEAITKERLQSSGGKLDLLLKDPQDNSMYEVEVMLGKTDESHIIRAIEYWDNEKRKYPHRKHTAVLVAEEINRRFFNVIHLFSHSIPIIAVQASLIQTASAQKNLFFTTLLNTYEEIDDGTSLSEHVSDPKGYWNNKAPWTYETAEALLQIVSSVLDKTGLRPVKEYVAVTQDDSNYMLLFKRSQGKSMCLFRMSQSLQDEAGNLLDGKNIPYLAKPKEMQITIDKELVQSNADAFVELARLVKRSWEDN